MKEIELREKAKVLLDYIERKEFDAVPTGYAKSCAEHVLAAIRPDDEEDATHEWWSSVQVDSDDPLMVCMGVDLVVSIRNGDREVVLWGSPTKGDLRRLCHALGLKVKEDA